MYEVYIFSFVCTLIIYFGNAKNARYPKIKINKLDGKSPWKIFQTFYSWLESLGSCAWIKVPRKSGVVHFIIIFNWNGIVHCRIFFSDTSTVCLFFQLFFSPSLCVCVFVSFIYTVLFESVRYVCVFIFIFRQQWKKRVPLALNDFRNVPLFV